MVSYLEEPCVDEHDVTVHPPPQSLKTCISQIEPLVGTEKNLLHPRFVVKACWKDFGCWQMMMTFSPRASLTCE